MPQRLMKFVIVNIFFGVINTFSTSPGVFRSEGEMCTNDNREEAGG